MPKKQHKAKHQKPQAAELHLHPISKARCLQDKRVSLWMDAGCVAGAQSCVPVPINHSRTHDVLEHWLPYFICPGNRRRASQGQVCLSGWWSCSQQLEVPGRGKTPINSNSGGASLYSYNIHVREMSRNTCNIHTEQFFNALCSTAHWRGGDE